MIGESGSCRKLIGSHTDPLGMTWTWARWGNFQAVLFPVQLLQGQSCCFHRIRLIPFIVFRRGHRKIGFLKTWHWLHTNSAFDGQRFLQSALNWMHNECDLPNRGLIYPWKTSYGRPNSSHWVNRGLCSALTVWYLGGHQGGYSLSSFVQESVH